MQDRTITITTDNGDEILCEILFTTHLPQFNKDYVVFVEKGTDNASAAIYIQKENGQGVLEQIKTEEEWKILEEMLDDYVSKQDAEEESPCASCNRDCANCDEECDEAIEE